MSTMELSVQAYRFLLLQHLACKITTFSVKSWRVIKKSFVFLPFHRRFPMFKMRELMFKMRELMFKMREFADREGGSTYI